MLRLSYSKLNSKAGCISGDLAVASFYCCV